MQILNLGVIGKIDLTQRSKFSLVLNQLFHNPIGQQRVLLRRAEFLPHQVSTDSVQRLHGELRQIFVVGDGSSDRELKRFGFAAFLFGNGQLLIQIEDSLSANVDRRIRIGRDDVAVVFSQPEQILTVSLNFLRDLIPVGQQFGQVLVGTFFRRLVHKDQVGIEDCRDDLLGGDRVERAVPQVDHAGVSLKIDDKVPGQCLRPVLLADSLEIDSVVGTDLLKSRRENDGT